MGCIKEPANRPGKHGGEFHIVISDYWTQEILAELEGTVESGGAVIEEDQVNITLQSDDHLSLIDVVLDVNRDSISTHHDAHLTLLYTQNGQQQYISAWDQPGLYGSDVLIIQNDSLIPDQVQLQLLAQTESAYPYVTEPSLGTIRIKGTIKAYLTSP